MPGAAAQGRRAVRRQGLDLGDPDASSPRSSPSTRPATTPRAPRSTPTTPSSGATTCSGPTRAGWGTQFGAGSLVADDGKTAQVPENWLSAWQWYYDGMWKDGFIPTGAENTSELLNSDNAFQSGNVAMDFVHLWYTCCAWPAEGEPQVEELRHRGPAVLRWDDDRQAPLGHLRDHEVDRPPGRGLRGPVRTSSATTRSSPGTARCRPSRASRTRSSRRSTSGSRRTRSTGRSRSTCWPTPTSPAMKPTCRTSSSRMRRSRPSRPRSSAAPASTWPPKRDKFQTELQGLYDQAP